MIYRMGTYAQRFAGETTLIPGDGTTAWTNVVGATTSLGKAIPSSTAVVWGKTGQYSSLPSNTDGYCEFTAVYMSGQSVNGIYMAGFSLSNAISTYADIDYKWYFEGSSGNRLSVLNVSRQNAVTGVPLADVLKVERTIIGGVGTVRFYRNGSLFYTHPTTTTSELFFAVDMYRYIGIENCKLVY